MAGTGPFAKFGAILKQIAPTLLTAVGGPAGAIAGQLIRKATGAAPDADLENVVSDALQTPEGLEKIKLAEIELQRFEADNDFKFSDLEVQDVNAARLHDVEMRKAGDKTTTQLAWVIVVSFVVLSAAIVVGHMLQLDGGMESTLVGIVIGYLVNEVKQVTAFYFGSSRGSREKDETIKTLGTK